MPLFDRIGRRMHPTEAGTLLLQHAHDVQRALAEAEDALAALR